MQKTLLILILPALWGCTALPPTVVEPAVPAPVSADQVPQNTLPTTDTPPDLVVGEEAAAAFDAAVEPLRPVIPDVMDAMGALNN